MKRCAAALLIVACATAMAAFPPVEGAWTALAQAQTYMTGNGPKTADQIRAELQAAGYAGPWDIDSMLHAYYRAATAPTVAPVPTQAAVDPSVAVPVAVLNSTNWAGLLGVNRTYTGVGASWTVPTVAASDPGSVAEWVGIDGGNTADPSYGSSSILQAGTISEPTAGATSAAVVAWVEAYPQPMVWLPVAVYPGDAVNVSLVQQGPSAYLLSFSDAAQQESYQQAITYAARNESAECVVEDPADASGHLRPFARFGSVPFSACWALANGSQAPLSQMPHALSSVAGASTANLTGAGAFVIVQN